MVTFDARDGSAQLIVLIRTKDPLVFRRVQRILVAMTPRQMQQFAAPYRKHSTISRGRTP
jgi:hypothetical protein